MRNSLKRALSLVLAILMLSSVAVMSVSANSGAKERHTLETAIEYFEKEYGEEIPLTTYYFYMPEEWKNEYNDYYDGTEDSYAAGIYWFGSTLALPDDYKEGAHSTNGWPGYALVNQDAPNVFVANIPYDVHTLIFNNLVDGGQDKTLPVNKAAYQIGDTATNYDGADDYGFYPNGLESTANMIYVIDPEKTAENPYSGQLTFGGAWFYYYGNGEYGIAPTKEEAAAVYSNGEFPASKLVVKPEKNEGMGIGETKELKVTKTPVTFESSDENIAVVEEVDGKYILKAVGEGDATITFKHINASEEEEVATVAVNVVTPSLGVNSMSLKVGESDFFIPVGIGDSAVWSTSNKKVATVEGGMVYAHSAGKATITVKQGDVVLKCTVTVKSNITLNSKKKVTVKVGKTSKIVVKGAKKVKYTTSNKKVASVSKKGVIKGLKKGKATIKVTADSKKFTVKVTVKKK